MQQTISLGYEAGAMKKHLRSKLASSVHSDYEAKKEMIDFSDYLVIFYGILCVC